MCSILCQCQNGEELKEKLCREIRLVCKDIIWSMTQEINHGYKRDGLLAASCWSCSNVVLPRPSFGMPLVLLWLSYGPFKWSRLAFDEGSKVMRRYTPLTNISSVTRPGDVKDICNNREIKNKMLC